MIDLLLFYLTILSDYRIGFLSISDWALMCLLFLSLAGNRFTISIKRNMYLPLALLLMGAFISGVSE